MISKKELQNQIDTLRTSLSVTQLKTIGDIQQDIIDLNNAVGALNNKIDAVARSGINDHVSLMNLKHRQYNALHHKIDDLCERVRVIEISLTSTVPSEVIELQEQVKCGVIGHEFQLSETIILPGNAACTKYDGTFICKKCDLKVTRKLTKAEITAAKKLGIIK